MSDNTIRKELAALQKMTPKQLRQRYRELYGDEARSGNRQWLLRRCAWRMQALAEGDMTERAKRVREQALAMANDADVRVIPPRTPVPEAELPRRVAATDLKPDDRLPMAHTDLAAGVREDNDARAAMLIRARVYAAAATEPNGPAMVVDKLNEQLAVLDWSPERITHAHDDLANRLAYLFAPPPAPEVAAESSDNEAATTEVAKATNTSDEPAAPSWRSFTDGDTESTTVESTTATATATAPDSVAPEAPSTTRTTDEQPEASATTSTDPHDWPTAICPECGRSYFPGWKREYEECSRCRHGHRNIFDFGESNDE